MKYLLHSVLLHLKSAAQYRASFLMQTLAQFIMTGGELAAVLVLLSRFTRLGQWNGPEILFFFGVMQLTFALTECFGRGISNFASYIGSGDFDAMLLRPRPLLLQVVCHRLDPRRLGGMIVGAAAVILASRHAGLVWSAGKLLVLILSMLGSFFLLCGLFLIEATASFFSVRSIEMVNVLTYGGRSACQYPVDIYPKPLRLLFTWVAPFALCMHQPVSWMLGKPMLNLPGWMTFAGPLSGVIFFALMACVWRQGAQHYRSTGT